MATPKTATQHVQGMSGAMGSAQSAIAKVTQQIEREDRALGRMAQSATLAAQKLQALSAQVASGKIGQDVYLKQAIALDALRDRIGAQVSKLAEMRKKLDALRNGEILDNNGVKQSEEAVQLLAKRLGVADLGVLRLGRSLAALGPIGALVIGTILGIVGAVSALSAVVFRGISGANAYREEWIKLRQTWASLYGFRGGTVLLANETQAAIGKVASTTALSREEITRYANQLIQARFRGQALTNTLQMMSMAAAGGGDVVAQRYLVLAARARYFGESLKGVNKYYEATFGPIARAKMLTWSAQMERASGTFRWLFSGADVEPLIRGLSSLLDLFDRNSKNGGKLKDVITKMTETGIGLFLRLELAVLNAYAWLLEHPRAWKMVKGALKAVGMAAAVVAAIVGGIVVAALVAATAVVYPIVVALESLGQGFVWAYEQLSGFAGKVQAELESWGTIGTAIAEGIAAGIRGGLGKVWEALKSITVSPFEKIRKLFEIHSPSGLTRRLFGLPFGQGMAVGIGASEGLVARASYGVGESARIGMRDGLGSTPVAPLPSFAAPVPAPVAPLPSFAAPVPAPVASASTGAVGASYGVSAAPAGGGPSFVFNNCNLGGLDEATAERILYAAFERARLGVA